MINMNFKKIQENAVNEIKRNKYLLEVLGSCIDTLPYMCWTKDLNYRFTSINTNLLENIFLTNDRLDVIGKTDKEVIDTHNLKKETKIEAPVEKEVKEA